MKHQDEKIKDSSLYDQSGLCSKIFFAWLIPLFKKGWKIDLDFGDLFKFCSADDPRKTSHDLERTWKKELERKDPSIVRALIRTFGLKYLLLSTILLITECACRTFQPLLIGRVVRFFSSRGNTDLGWSDETTRNAYLATSAIVITTIIETFGRNHYQLLVRRIALNCRTSITILTYKKILKLSKSSFEKTNIGQIINILANDLHRFEEMGHFLMYIVVAPLQSVIVMYFMFFQLGFSAVGGLAILFVFIPFQGIMGRLFNKFRTSATIVTDRRVKMISEIIDAMKLVKVYCWERLFSEDVSEIRKKEITQLRWCYVLKGTNSALFYVATRLMLFASFVTFVLMGGSLTAETVFVTMALFNALRVPVTNHLPYAVGLLAEVLVACKRIQEILLLEDRQPIKVDKTSSEVGSVVLKDYTAKWSKSLPFENLSNVNFKVKPGELVAVIGSVGSGKSCLLHAILNELDQVAGGCHVNGRVSYAPQEAWCFAGTIRDNITLGDFRNNKRYQQVVKVCSLESDFKLFPEGDKTFIGEKGHTLSGGQRARISLARAAYVNADVYLLDDPLSAVDPHVAKHIFEECIKKFLAKKTVILVTHQLQFIRKADKILVVKDQEVLVRSSVEDALRKDISREELADIEKKRSRDELSDSSTGRRQSSSRRRSSISLLQVARRQSVQSRRHSIISNHSDDDLAELTEFDEDDDDDSPNKEAIDNRAESREKGTVKLSVYWRFIRAGASIPSIILVILALLSPQVIINYTDLWLAHWTKNFEMSANITATLKSEMKNIYTYSGLITALFWASFLCVMSVYFMSLSCSIELHKRMLANILRAPMSFFDVNPAGRILNRFTRDLGQVDQKIPVLLDDLLGTILTAAGILVTSVIINPYLVFPAVALVIISIPFRSLYLRTASDVRRLDGVVKSPVFSHIATTFDGLTPLRAFGLELQFIDQFYSYMNDAQSVRFLVHSCGRAYSFLLDSFGLYYICAICIFLMFFPDGIPSEDVGLVLSQMLVLIGLFQTGVRKTSDFETQMVFAERVLEYERLPAEAPLGILNTKDDAVVTLLASDEWPRRPTIEFRNVCVSYGDEESGGATTVLRNLSFTIKDGEKIGVVGRTGAGKSTLISVLFRLVEPDGEIYIDHVDTKMLGLHHLRSKISIIPQDPVLFSGTIRKNLDPHATYKDEELWNALRDANLGKTVQYMPGGLDAIITEGGANLSAGQKQLVCLARALLKRNKILVLDEATASCDQETDDIIQGIIRTKFKTCTVITVAHRLNTIVDADRVLVLDAGSLVEFDEPYTLLNERKDGYFSSMVKQTGEQSAKELLDISKKAYDARRSDDKE